MNRPNYRAWLAITSKKRELCFFIRYDDDMDAFKMYIGFIGASMLDIQARGTIFFSVSKNGLFKQACRILYTNNIIMI